MRFGLALILCGGMAVPAAACINDSELPSHEREFRSQYGEVIASSPTPSVIQPRDAVVSHPMLLGSGVALLTGAFFLSVNGKRSRD